MKRIFLYKLAYSFKGVERWTWVEATTVEKARTIGRILIGNRIGWLPKYRDINVIDCFEYSHKITWTSCQDNSL